jgi:hypothetical protein
MKTLSKLLVFILFFSVTNCVTAQKKTPAEIMGIKMLKQKSVKGKSNEYRIMVYDNNTFIINKGNVYDTILPNYNLEDAVSMPFGTLSGENWAKLKQFTTELIGDYVSKVPKTDEYRDYIDIKMISDMQGNIKDLEFGLPNYVSIPIEAIEQLEAYVKKNMKLKFNINRINQNANYMFTYYGIQLEPIRKARKMKGK